MAKQDFPTEEVLSVVTGRLLCDIGGVYRLLSWMSGEQLFTHQLPRVAREAKPGLLAAMPALGEAVKEAEQVNHENWESWRDKWLDRYGPTIAVPKMTIAEHERKEPLSELAETIHPDRIVVVGEPTPSTGR